MAKFVFKLQPVLNIKLQKEESLKNELGKAIQKLEFEKNRFIEIEEAMNNMAEKFNEKAKKIRIRKLIEYKEYLVVLDAKKKIQKENVNKAAIYVDKVREELLNAVKERKILERLKEKKFDEFLLEEKKLEQKINDEIVSYNHSDIKVYDGSRRE